MTIIIDENDESAGKEFIDLEATDLIKVKSPKMVIKLPEEKRK
jgi:hypothetical protein